ncbi:MAG: hypothetical protein PHW62_00675 [Candidatus Ratteibacteria bacterium]|nr:hypothetical protein [Candidatus Ratteibacteria bacterium]
MAKRTNNKREQKELNFKGIALLIAVAAVAYILYTNMLAILVGSFLTIIIVLVVIMVGAYFILPAIGVGGIAALFGGLGGLIGLSKK